jgi:hypothetical protein
VILTSPDWRAVIEDSLGHNFRPLAWLARMGIAYANANAYAYADANAYAYADADADANANTYADANANTYADANADADADAYGDTYADVEADVFLLSFSGGLYVKNGLYLYAMPNGSMVVLRVGWLRHTQGDEYEALNVTTPLRKGDYKTQFADVAIDGPPKSWDWTRPLPRASPLNRFHCLGPVSLDPKQFAKVCPRPEDWVE